MNITLHGIILRNPRTALVLLVVLCYLPFIGKAFHIDDPLFIWTAKHIQGHPLDFYGFSVNWYGWDEPVSLITKNPPLYSYYLAGAALLLGWSEQAMHIASLLPLLALVLGTYRLALQLRADPFVAALFTICAPVFLLTGTTVMCDLTMTALWVWGVYFWLYGFEEEGGSAALFCAAILVILAGLTKYFGMALLPLLAIYGLCKRLPLMKWLPFLLLPLAAFALYQWETGQLYGTPLISEAARYSLKVRQLSFGAVGENFLIGLSFAGGSLLTPLLAAPFLFRARGWVAAGTSMAFICVILSLMGTLAGFKLAANPLQLLQVALFILAGGGLLIIALDDLNSERNPESILLLLWVFGTFFFAALFNWTVSGRNMLPLAPVAGILLSRRLSVAGFTGKSPPLSTLSALLLPLLAISLMVAMADYRSAGEAKKAALLAAGMKQPGADIWFQGHWGFQYYLEEKGGRAIDFNSSTPKSGDILVTPSFGTNIRKLNHELLTTINTIQSHPLAWLSTFNIGSGAGFYSSRGGPLPFSFGKAVSDNYRIEQYQSLNSIPTGGSR